MLEFRQHWNIRNSGLTIYDQHNFKILREITFPRALLRSKVSIILLILSLSRLILPYILFARSVAYEGITPFFDIGLHSWLKKLLKSAFSTKIEMNVVCNITVTGDTFVNLY